MTDEEQPENRPDDALEEWQNYPPENMLEEEAESKGPEGIAGWLILPLIGLVLNPFLYGVYSYMFITTFIEDQTKYLILADGLQAFAISLFAFYCLVRFFQKKTQVPALVTFLYVVIIIDAGLELVYTSGDYQVRKDFISVLIVSSIWIIYFARSKRVKNTFVR
jgi:hypothetical protein